MLRTAHSAQADIHICAIIVEHLCYVLNITSVEALWQISENARLPTHMNFGKHKGTPLVEVPKDCNRFHMHEQLDK